MIGSLKLRLTILLLVAIGGLGGFLMTEAYSSAQRAANRAFDSQLRAAALTIAQSIKWDHGTPTIKIPVVALKILATRHQERVFYVILNADGSVITGNMPATVITSAWQQAATHHPVLHSTYFTQAAIRVYGYTFDTAGWQAQEPVQIWVGHTTSGRQELASELFRAAMTRFTVVVVLATMLLILAMQAILKPLQRLRQALRGRASDDMRPLRIRVPSELTEFTNALNSLFARQRESRQDLIRFTADASHQIKTPLTGLRSACELALQSERPREWHDALELVHANVLRTSRLAEQLLSLARISYSSDDEALESIDLFTLLRNCVLEWADAESARRHNLGLTPAPADDITIRGDALALHELIGNLVDNALRYTPTGTTITLGLEIHGNNVTLFIEDDGGGVPEWLLGRLHQPFERANKQDTSGSGLGMAVVHSIARAHNADLSYANRPCGGLRVCVYFPMET